MSRRPGTALRPAVVVPILLTLLALVLRLITLNAQPLSPDEAYHLQQLSWLETIRLDLAFNPPLFRLLVRAVTGFVPTGWAARVVPLLAGVATIPLLVVLGQRRLGLVPASVAGLLLAVHPWHIRHSQTIRAYALLTLLVLLTTFLSWAPERDRPTSRPRIAAHLLAGALMAATHYLGFVYLMGQAAWLLWQRQWRHGLLNVALLGLLVALFLPAVVTGTGAKTTHLQQYVTGLPFLWDLLRCLTTPGGLSLVALLGLMTVGAAQRAALPVDLPLALGIVPVALLGLVIPIEVRYALPALPLALLLAGVGFQWLRERFPARSARSAGAALLALAVVGVAWLLPTYYGAPTDPAAAARHHRDLVHEPTPLGPLLKDALPAPTPLVVVGRGQVVHQVLYLLHDRHYPGVAQEQLPRDAQRYTSPDHTVVCYEAPAPPATHCPSLPSMDYSLLVEAPFPCDLPNTCSPEGRLRQFTLYHCLTRSHGGRR